MFNSLLYERERKRHERSFENFISCEHFCRLIIYLFIREERELLRKGDRGSGGGVVSRFRSSRRRARESAFLTSLSSRRISGKILLLLFRSCVL